MGEPAAVFKVNGTKLQSQAPVPRLCEGISVEQFWSERLQTLKRYLESTQTSSDTAGGEPDSERRPLAPVSQLGTYSQGRQVPATVRSDRWLNM